MHALNAHLKKRAAGGVIEHILEPTVEERVERCRVAHFETGKEEIFAMIYTDIYTAAYHGDLPGVRAILNNRKLDVQQYIQGGETPLHYAARGRKAHIITFLLDHGVDVNASNALGWTPLHIAAAADFGDMIELLYSRGARMGLTDKAGHTPAHIAANAGCVDALKAIYACQPPPRTIDILNVKSKNGLTPLHVAARFNQFEAVKYLVEVGLDVNDVDVQGETPAHKAGRAMNQTMVKYFQEHGCEMEALNNEVSQSVS